MEIQMTGAAIPEPSGEDNENDKVHTDIKPGWDKRPDQYPATRGDGDNVNVPSKTDRA